MGWAGTGTHKFVMVITVMMMIIIMIAALTVSVVSPESLSHDRHCTA